VRAELRSLAIPSTGRKPVRYRCSLPSRWRSYLSRVPLSANARATGLRCPLSGVAYYKEAGGVPSMVVPAKATVRTIYRASTGLLTAAANGSGTS
jgi:hypothetical protein